MSGKLAYFVAFMVVRAFTLACLQDENKSLELGLSLPAPDVVRSERERDQGVNPIDAPGTFSHAYNILAHKHRWSCTRQH